ncbi:hypothetical protein MKX07_004612 [Trichoderma sp. CBMAI-0711]|uniref:Uncharacterized protein n=1 Tax=Trichoderma parareesei TaxID=858221 RepID=A0A2H2ZMG3_TRIPA|nr:hypothetical protein MKX07_004612 [Trichoderma sp. CBMAI-0711]OTA07973.1 hypothetical protein A9Z42_0089040 [Trichoderma parareesei]
MTKPVESASHKGQRRPDVPKCRRLQLEALPAGEGARALALVLSLRPMCSASQTDRPATVRCKRGGPAPCCSLALEHVAPDPKGQTMQTKTTLDGQAEHICTDLTTHGSQRLRDPSYAA